MSHLHLLNTSRIDQEGNDSEWGRAEWALYNSEPVIIGKTLANKRHTIWTSK